MEISSYRIQSQSHQSLTPSLSTHNDKDQINPTNKVSNLAQMISTTDPQGLINLGKMAIGDATIREWSDKGLEVDDQSFIAAAKALQEGFKAIVDALGTETAGSKVAINKHQIVINNQSAVPDWFTAEYDYALQSLSDNLQQESFKSGELFFSSINKSENLGLQNYNNVLNYS